MRSLHESHTAAELPIRYGGELTNVARLRFDHQPSHYELQARRALFQAVAGDPELAWLYGRMRLLSNEVEASLCGLTGPAVAAAGELAIVAASIQTAVDVRDIQFPLHGEWGCRALALSGFAIQTIKQIDTLYPHLDGDLPVNTIDYWQEVDDRLSVQLAA